MSKIVDDKLLRKVLLKFSWFFERVAFDDLHDIIQAYLDAVEGVR